MTDNHESTGSERVVGTDLSTVVEYNETARGLAEIKQQHGGVVFNVTVPKEMKIAKEVRATLVKLRTTLDARREELVKPALERQRVLNAEAKRITGEIRAIEEPIDVQIKIEEKRAEQVRLEKLEAERLRLEAINKRIDQIRNLPASLVGKPAVIIQGQLAKLKADELSEDEFQEHFITARDAHTAAIARVEDVLRAQLDVDAEKKRQAQRDADMAAMQAKLDAQQALIDKAAADAKAEAERVAEDAAAAERAKLDEQRQREENEIRRLQGVRARIANILELAVGIAGTSSEYLQEKLYTLEQIQPGADPDYFAELFGEAGTAWDETHAKLEAELAVAVEREHVAAQAKAAQEAEEIRQEAVRQQQAATKRELDKKAAKIEADRKAAAKKAEAERLASLGLREAAQALVSYCDQDEPEFDRVNELINDLRAALVNDTAPIAKPARAKKAANA